MVHNKFLLCTLLATGIAQATQTTTAPINQIDLQATGLAKGQEVKIAQNIPVVETFLVVDTTSNPTVTGYEYVYSPFHYASYGAQVIGAIYALSGIAELLNSQFNQPQTTPTDAKKEQKKRVERVQQENKVWTGFGIYLVGILAQLAIDKTFGKPRPVEIATNRVRAVLQKQVSAPTGK